MTTARNSIDQHPDLLALRACYGRAAESVTAAVRLGWECLVSPIPGQFKGRR